VSEFLDKLSGIVFVLGGIYALLLAYRVLPANPKDPERAELWHRKFGKMVKVLAPIVILAGILLLLDVL
jgi:hypothetical protein